MVLYTVKTEIEFYHGNDLEKNKLTSIIETTSYVGTISRVRLKKLEVGKYSYDVDYYENVRGIKVSDLLTLPYLIPLLV